MLNIPGGVCLCNQTHVIKTNHQKNYRKKGDDISFHIWSAPFCSFGLSKHGMDIIREK
jgi:hypothetical protein